MPSSSNLMPPAVVSLREPAPKACILSPSREKRRRLLSYEATGTNFASLDTQVEHFLTFLTPSNASRPSSVTTGPPYLRDKSLTPHADLGTRDSLESDNRIQESKLAMLELENKQHIDQLDRLTLTVNESRAELALAKNSEEHRFSVLLHDLLAARESYEHILTDERTARAQLERTICQMSEEARASRHIEDSLRRHLAREARKAEVLESQMERAQTAIDRSKRAEAAAEESDELARAWQDCAADAEIRMRMAEKKAVVAERQVAELRKQLELFRSPSSLPSASPSLNTNGSSSSIAPQARPGKARISSEERHRSSPPALSNQKLRQGNHASPLRIPLRPLHLV